MKDEKSYRWKVLIAAYLASFTFGFSLQSVPPVLGLLIQDFRLTHAEAGLAISLFALPMIPLSIPVGIIADRYGSRLVGLTAFALTMVGHLMVAFAPDFSMLLAGRALAGLGGFTLALVGPQLVSRWFLGKELGVAMGIWNTAFPLATILSLAAMGSIGEAFGWRAPMLIAVGVAAVSTASFGQLVRPTSLAEKHVQAQDSFLSTALRAGALIWFVGIAWLFFTASSLSFLTFAPDHFRSVGYAVSTAGLLSGMMLWGTFLTTPLVGLLVDRGWSKEALIVAGSLLLALTLFLIPGNPSWVVPILLLAALSNSFVVVPIFALPPSVLGPGLLGLGYGVLATCLNIGTALGPLVAGLARDLTGSYTASFWAMALMALLVSVSVVPLLVSRRGG